MKQRQKYVFLVYCNAEPHKLVYAVFISKKSALKYAQSLIKYREDRAKERGWNFGYYHYETEMKKETEFDRREKMILSCCLRIEDGATTMSENATYIQVIRRNISK
jgi:hypothetical protein